MGNPFVTVVCPALGNVLGVAMLVAPTPAVIGVRKSGTLGALNPLPYPLTALNCVGWIAYGLSLKDVWLIPANIVGLAGGLFFTLQVMPYVPRRTQDVFMGLLVAASVYFSVLGIIGSIALDETARNQMWGIQCVVVLMAYYAIPLSTMVEVIKTRNAASIYIPLAVAAALNGGLWTAYGLFAIHDFNVYMPNLAGALLALLQLVLRFVYGAKDHHPLGPPQHSVNGLHPPELDAHTPGKHPHRVSLDASGHDGPHGLREGSGTGLLAAHNKAAIHVLQALDASPFPAATIAVPTTVALGTTAVVVDGLPSTPAPMPAPPGA